MTLRRLLVVDDHPDAAEALAMLLEIAGHEVRIALDAAAALAEAERLRPEVALLDLSLPDLDGYELAKAMRQQPWGASMQFVAVTGSDSGEEHARVRRTRGAAQCHAE